MKRALSVMKELRSFIKRHATAVGALVLFFLPLLPVLAGTRLLLFRDAFITHFPIAQLAVSLERKGIVPFLNFAASNVEPLIPDPNAVVLYPTHLLYRVLPAPAAFNLHLLLHVAWAFFGAALLARRLGAGREASWIGGATYAFSGPYLSYAAAFTNAAAAAAWAPWAVAAAVRVARRGSAQRGRAAMALGIALGLQLLAGEPAISAWTLAACGIPLAIPLFSRERIKTLARTLPPAAAGGLLALAIAAPLLLATRAAIPYSFRGEHLFSRDQFNAAGNVPVRAAETLLPLVFGSPRPLISGTFWGYGWFDSLQPYLYSLNFGLVPLLLIFSAIALRSFRRTAAVPVVAGSTLLFLLLSFGFRTPLFEVLYAISPLRHFRYPIKFVLPAALGISTLAALASDAWLSRNRCRAFRAAAFATAIVLAGLAAGFLLAPTAVESIVASSFRGLQVGPRQVMPGIAATVYRDALFGAAGMALAIAALERFRGRARALGLLGAVMLTLVPAGWPLFVTVPAAPYQTRPALGEIVAGTGRTWVANIAEFAVAKFGTRRSVQRDDIGEIILAGRRELWPLTGAPEGARYAYDKDPDGSYGFVDRVFFEAVASTPPDVRSRLLLAASTRYAVMAASDSALSGFHPRARSGVSGRTVVVWEADRPIPVVRVSNRIFYRSSLSGAVDLVGSPRFDPATNLLLRGADRNPSEPPAAAPALSDARESGNGFTAVIQSETPAVAFFAATYFRYWKGTIDGSAAPVEIANGSFCGIRVPAGRHTVALFYDEGPFRRGAALSLGAAALAILASVPNRK